MVEISSGAERYVEDYALQWITLTGKVKLLSEELKRKPQDITLKDFPSPLKSMKVKKFNDMNKSEQFLDSAQLRFIELMEEYLKWITLSKKF